MVDCILYGSLSMYLSCLEMDWCGYDGVVGYVRLVEAHGFKGVGHNVQVGMKKLVIWSKEATVVGDKKSESQIYVEKFEVGEVGGVEHATLDLWGWLE